MPFKLKTKQIHVGSETLTVFQASNLMEIKRSIMISEADVRWQNEEAKDMEAQAKRYLETLLYPSLLACTSGNVPTLEEFINSVPASDSDLWMAAARELNSRWFPDLSEKTDEEKEAENQKKQTPQTGSSPD